MPPPCSPPSSPPARLGLEVNVTGWLALAENMPSGSAVRPGDVLRMFSGKTVEVLNTDAEGRLVLADALWAASQEKPDAIVDVATLTGAMSQALGSRTFGIMANDDAFRTTVHEAAQEVGEESWPMPLPEHLRKGLDSHTADIANKGERMGRRPDRRSVPARVNRRGHSLGAPGHRRPRLQQERPVRLHAQGRHRQRGAHARPSRRAHDGG